MTHLLQTNKKGFNDLVFDQRNQAYGAYVLRREYPVNVLKSLLISIAILASVLAIPYLAKLLKKEDVKQKVITYDNTPVLKDLKEKEDVKPEIKQQKQEPPSGNSRLWTPPVIVEFNNDSMLTALELERSNPGRFNSNGPGEFVDLCPECTENMDTLIGEKRKVYPYAALEVKPEFPGGDPALREFLGNNLAYPEHAKNIGLEGKVYITFIIDEFGNVINAAVAREVGGGLDEEALRVVQMMPRWKPGRQAGYPVRVSYQLPIIFDLN